MTDFGTLAVRMEAAVPVNGGAVKVWGDAVGKDAGWTANIVKAIAKSFKIDLDKPWAKLGDKAREVLLYGTGEKRVAVEWNGRHSSGAWDMKFEGILPQLERRHRESSSDRVRAHYESFFRAIACVTCHGVRDAGEQCCNAVSPGM